MKVLHINTGLEKGGGLSHIVNLLTEAKRQNVDFELLTLADGPVAKAAKKAKIKTTINSFSYFLSLIFQLQLQILAMRACA